MFTVDAFLTVINLIYKNLSNHQTLDRLSTTINTIKSILKMECKFG